MGIFSGFGLIDIFFIILCLRITYEAVSKGIFVEIFKILALFINSIFTFQFYSFFAGKISEKISFLDQNYVKAITAVLMFFIIGIVFGLLVKIIDALFKKKEIIFAEKMAAMVLGFVRLAFLTSMLVFFLHLFPAAPQFISGYTSRIFRPIAPKTYLVLAEGFNKIIPAFTVNTEVKSIYEAKSDLSGSNQKGN
jgi:uncharacterized membrane protein required for colicin V production